MNARPTPKARPDLDAALSSFADQYAHNPEQALRQLRLLLYDEDTCLARVALLRALARAVGLEAAPARHHPLAEMVQTACEMVSEPLAQGAARLTAEQVRILDQLSRDPDALLAAARQLAAADPGRAARAAYAAVCPVRVVLGVEARQEGAGGWELCPPAGERFDLPPDTAGRCYGTDAQEVALRLSRAPVPGSEGLYHPLLAVSPAPTRGPLTVTLTFPGAHRRTWTIPPPEGEATAPGPAPLPASAFAADAWRLSVELR